MCNFFCLFLHQYLNSFIYFNLLLTRKPTDFAENSRISCVDTDQTRHNSDAALCCVWSGFARFAYYPFTGFHVRIG